ncbi:biorientation of chromosomes in cell division protein 1-like 1 isoform X2 [Drosophila eugracilis]|uniref:biorientation of chromosomes in cell division protein 1-like 1 isoform X2 n=1 Tax=Drosophila eugracilis TaxID=29029 RepID=UPI001BD97D69|nr:biorientation of chromosomes in cell division protein 1-like 1 isoform X2 [Drosophila eugracilis]
MDDLIKTLIAEVKSQGVFDEFRFNCCLADVDTKPAYQNVRTRVETAVNDFLAKQHWTPETNKVQLRERLRKHLLDSDVLDKGVDQIVDQVVNPKVATIFEPRIESIVYKYLGITPPPPPPARSSMLSAPPLPPFAGHMNGSSSLLNVETPAGLLPTDLEQISPDSDRATVKSEVKDEDLPPGVDEEDLSRSYEPMNELKPLDSKELNNGSLNNSDSINGVSQASQLSQVSSDSRLTIASSTESVADAHQTTSTLKSGDPANISEEAQMPKFSENSSDACVKAGENGSRQLHFDIKQDAITFEGTERKNSTSKDTNGDRHALSIEDAIMSELKANIDDANNVEPEAVQLPVPPKVDPPPPPPLPKSEPLPALQPPALHEIHPPPPPAQIIVAPPPPPPTIDQPPPPPEPSKVELPPPPAPPTVNPPPTPQVTEKNGSIKEDALDSTSKETDNLEELPNALDAGVKKDAQIPSKAEANEDQPPPQEVKTPKEEVAKSSMSIASPISASKSHSKSRDKEKDRRHHSHSHDKQRRRSRDRDRDRDRSRDKSHSKHSSSSSSKHSSSHSSSSKHRSSSSKNDKSSSSSSRSNRESSSSKRSSTTSSSRHESSSHKKHKSSSYSSRSDRDKNKEKEKETQSRSHHSSSNSSSSSKRRDHDKGRDRDRNKSNNSGNSQTKAIQDDHNENKVKLKHRRSSDSNDEGKPPSSDGIRKTSQPEISPAPEKADAPAENGNGTNGNSNGSSNGGCDSAVSVVIVSDILQQSSTSFIELTAGSQSHKVLETNKLEAIDIDEKRNNNQPETRESEAKKNNFNSEDKEEELHIADKSVPDSPVKESKVDGLETEPVPTNETKKKLAKESVPENLHNAVETSDPIEVRQLEEQPKKADKPASQIQNSNDQGDELVADFVTHFEENSDEFKPRLQLINQLIQDYQSFVNRLSADGLQDEPVDVRALRRSISKRRRSSLLEQQQVVRESTPARLSSPSSSTSGSPAKRLRREEPKSSPTPSDGSINSKENEALEKQEHAV